MFPYAIESRTPFCTRQPSGDPARRILGGVLHHTATTGYCVPHANGSWHYLVDRDGSVHAEVPEDAVAWHVARTDRWHPDWVLNTAPWFAGSTINSCTIGIELVGHPQTAPGYTPPQLEALGKLLDYLGDTYPDLWWVGHGEVQADRADPASFPWEALGFGARDPRNGRRRVSSSVKPEQQRLLDACARHDLVSDDAIDQLMGRYDLLASQVTSLRQLLIDAQGERDGAMNDAINWRDVAHQMAERLGVTLGPDGEAT